MITNEDYFMAVNALENIGSVIDTLIGIGCLTEDEEKQFNEAADILANYLGQSRPEPDANYLPKLPKGTWTKAFAALVEIAMDKGYFDDILNHSLYHCYYEKSNEMDYDEAMQMIDYMWERVGEAFEEVFGVERGETGFY